MPPRARVFMRYGEEEIDPPRWGVFAHLMDGGGYAREVESTAKKTNMHMKSNPHFTRKQQEAAIIDYRILGCTSVDFVRRVNSHVAVEELQFPPAAREELEKAGHGR